MSNKDILYFCSGYCAASSYDLLRAHNTFAERLEGFNFRRYKNILVFFDQDEEKIISIFSYGVIIFWGFDKPEENSILESIVVSKQREIDFVEFERLPVLQSNNIDISICDVNIKRNDHREKLAFTIAFAQSLKLDFFSSTIEDSAQDITMLAESLSKTGTVSLSRVQLSKKIGEVFLKKNMVNLRSDIMDLPEILWTHDHLDNLHTQFAEYFTINERMDVMNKRLDTMSDLLLLLSEELRFRASANVELVIMLLILLEVFLAVVHWIF